MSKTQVFVVCFVIAALSFGIGFIAGFHYQEPAKTSASGQQYYSSKTYTLDLQSHMPFGKHKGKTVMQVIEEEPDYLRWMQREVKRVTFAEDVKKAIDSR